MRLRKPETLRIKRRLVAISSVLAVLMLMTTISYNAVYAVEEAPNKQVSMPEVSSSSYIVMSGSTSEVVIEHHAERKMPPGKIAMLLTAMVVLDNMYNDSELRNSVTINDTLAEYGETFKKGDVITVDDLLSAMLVGGNGQAAEALASYSASKRGIFIKEMNTKALELDLLDTNFTNPSGSYNIKQYSSAHDCAVITQAAERYQLIAERLGETSKKIKVANGKDEREVVVSNTNPLLVNSSEANLYRHTRGGILGKSTRPSESAQYAGIATIDDMKLVVVLMDSDFGKVGGEAKGLFEYANSKVTRNTIVKADKRVGRVRVRGGEVTRVPAYTETRGFAYVPPEGSDDLIQTEIYVYKNLEAPLKKGAKVGEFRIKVADEVKGTVDLVIKRDVEMGWFPSWIYISNAGTIAIGASVLAILSLVVGLRLRKLRRRKRREKLREERVREIVLQQIAMDEDRRARNWNYRTDYNKLAPRTSDIRKEALQEALDKVEGTDFGAKRAKGRRGKPKQKK